MEEYFSVKFPYEDPDISGVSFPAGNLSGSYYIRSVPVITDIKSEVIRVLAEPTGSPSLESLLSNRDVGNLKVSIIVDDISRPTPVNLILPVVLGELHDAGVQKKNIVITCALGTHRPMTGPEMIKKVGKEIYSEYNVQNSHFDDYSMLTLAGYSENGVPVYIDSNVAEADFRIGIGSVTPHGAVGWSGGGKIIYPGVAGKETVKRFHFLHGLTEKNMKGLEECSVRLEMEQWVEVIGLDFIINSVLDHNGDVYKLTAGHYVAAQREGVSFGKEIYSYPDEEKADLVVAVSYPHDDDFWQAAKGIYAGEQLLKEGGTLMLVTPCREGAGNHPLFFERSGDDRILDKLKAVLSGESDDPEDPVSMAPSCMMRKMLKRIRIKIVSPGLAPELVAKAGYSWGSSIQEEIDRFLEAEPQARVSIVNHCDLTFV